MVTVTVTVTVTVMVTVTVKHAETVEISTGQMYHFLIRYFRSKKTEVWLIWVSSDKKSQVTSIY